MHDARKNSDHKEPTFARDLDLFDATMIGVGAMIGAGIFVLTGIAAGVAGPASILAFALNGFVTLLHTQSWLRPFRELEAVTHLYAWLIPVQWDLLPVGCFGSLIQLPAVYMHWDLPVIFGSFFISMLRE